MVARHDLRVLRESMTWLVRSREHTNFTYPLAPLNRTHLEWFCAEVAGASVASAREYTAELESDDDLRRHVHDLTMGSDRRWLADDRFDPAKRFGWYAILRMLKPDHVVETGTDKGLGSVILAAALLRNGAGHLTTIDINNDSGYLITGRYADVTDRVIGDSVAVLNRRTAPVDLFLHDSLHTREHELAEYAAVDPHLTSGALVVSDNAHATDALPSWAEQTGRRFLFFAEMPIGHWYPGSGIGVALGSGGRA